MLSVVLVPEEPSQIPDAPALKPSLAPISPKQLAEDNPLLKELLRRRKAIVGEADPEPASEAPPPPPTVEQPPEPAAIPEAVPYEEPKVETPPLSETAFMCLTCNHSKLYHFNFFHVDNEDETDPVVNGLV